MLGAADDDASVCAFERTLYAQQGVVVGVLRDGDHIADLARRLEVVGQLIRVRRHDHHRLIDDRVFLPDLERGAAIRSEHDGGMRFAQPEADAIRPFGQSVALYLFARDALIHHRLLEHVTIVVVGERIGREDDVVARRRTLDADGRHVLPAADTNLTVHLLERSRHIHVRLIFGVLRDGDHALYLARRFEVVGQLVRVRRQYVDGLVDDCLFLLNTERGAAIRPYLFARPGIAQHKADAVIAFGQSVAQHLLARDALIYHRLPEHLAVIRRGERVRREDDAVSRRRAVDAYGSTVLPAPDADVAVYLLKPSRHVEARLIVGILRDGDHALYLARRLKVVGQLVRIRRQNLNGLVNDRLFLLYPERRAARFAGLFKLIHPSRFDKQPEANTIRSRGQSVAPDLFACNTTIPQSLFAKDLLQLAIRQRVGSKAHSGRYSHVPGMRCNSRIRADPYPVIVRTLDIPIQIVQIITRDGHAGCGDDADDFTGRLEIVGQLIRIRRPHLHGLCNLILLRFYITQRGNCDEDGKQEPS